MPEDAGKHKRFQGKLQQAWSPKRPVSKTITSFFSDLISFNSPLAIVINLTIILLILFFLPTETLLQGPNISLYQNIVPLIIENCPNSGFFADCELPSYGLTRGMSRLLHGDITGALSYNRGTILLFMVMTILLIANIRKLYKEYNYTK